MAAYQVVKSHQVERFGDAIDPMSRKTSALLRHFSNKQLDKIGRFLKILWPSQNIQTLSWQIYARLKVIGAYLK